MAEEFAGRRISLCYQVVQLGKGHTSHEVIDTRNTNEVNIAKSSSHYVGVTSPKTKQILESQRSTSKHFERGIKLRGEGNIKGPLYEGMTIQQRLRSNKESMTIAKISLKFKNLMSK